MPTCAVFGCANRSSKKLPGITFHSFPKDNERRKKWIRAIKRENWSPSRYSTVCSYHFTESDFDRTSLCVVRLREWAVPSVFTAFPRYLQRKSKGMEEPCFIKCESGWPLDSEETSNLEFNATSITGQLAVTTIKVEKRDQCIKEECANECQEAVKTEVYDDECDIDETPLDDVESFSTSSSAEVAESNTNEKRKGYEENLAKNKKTHSCVICGKAFRRRKNLCNHMSVRHSDVKRYSCSLCGETFGHHSSLTSHLISHSGERQFICSTCGMSFKLKVNLGRHEIVHSDLREFSCSTCGREFNQYSSFKRHAYYAHQGNGPQACTVCGRSFAVRSALTRHLITHSKERPHSCVTCGKMYAQKAHLKRHLQRSSTCVSS